MTRNQIEYWNYIENSRHNKAVEKEQEAHNRATRNEILRSNRARERLTAQGNAINALNNSQRNAETYRHNYATEVANLQSLDVERQRVGLGYYSSNVGLEAAKVSAGVGYANVGLGYANLGELNRHNMMQEGVAGRNILTQEKNAYTNLLQAANQQRKLQLEQRKWNEAQKGNVLADTTLKAQQLIQSQATVERMANQNVTDKVNASANLLGAASRLIPKGGFKK